MLLQRRAQGCGDASALIVLMDIQPVKIARAVNIAKADNRPVFLCQKLACQASGRGGAGAQAASWLGE